MNKILKVSSLVVVQIENLSYIAKEIAMKALIIQFTKKGMSMKIQKMSSFITYKSRQITNSLAINVGSFN